MNQPKPSDVASPLVGACPGKRTLYGRRFTCGLRQHCQRYLNFCEGVPAAYAEGPFTPETGGCLHLVTPAKSGRV